MTKRQINILLACVALILILILGLVLRSRVPQPEAAIDYDASMSPTAPISGEMQETWSAVLTARVLTLTPPPTPTRT